jgi:hypothetical protein
MIGAGETARPLSARIDQLVADRLPGGHRKCATERVTPVRP